MEIFPMLLSLLFIGFFAGIETAFVTANKLRVELLKDKGSYSARIISFFNHHPALFISTMLIGLNIALIVFGTLLTEVLNPDFLGINPEKEFLMLLIQTLITTFIVLVFGELLPKLIFRINSDRVLLWFAYPVYFFYILLRPLGSFFNVISRFIIVTIFRSEYVEARPKFTEEDLEYLVKESVAAADVPGQETDELNSEIFEKALYLKDEKVRNCMVPRTEIQAIEVSQSMEELRRLLISTRHSRIIIFQENIDTILGYVHHFDLMKSPATIRQMIRPILIVPPSMNAQDLLSQFIRERKNIAWVVDEYGGTAGIITLEDLMEEIFGEIEDEHDDEQLAERQLSDNEFIFSGRLEVDYLNEKYELEIPDDTDEYSTLSGYILHRNEDIPEKGEEMVIDHFVIQVLTGTDKRVDTVRLKRTDRNSS